MTQYYSDEKNVQIVVALLKEHGIRKVIASPGTTNVTFVRSIQIDPFFEIYSSADERSAAYMACGLAAESGEPVVITCTGATASRNYLPGLTEAYYRKLPILALTSTRNISKYGHHEDQVIDRTVIPKDVAKLSLVIPTVKDHEDVWECEIKMNQAILELKRRGGGPVHVNLTTVYTRSFTTIELPNVRIIRRITEAEEFPVIPPGKVALFIGSHHPFTQKQTEAIDCFCATYNAIALCDHTSGYSGKYKVLFPIVMSQINLDKGILLPDILIHLGEISGFYSFFVGKPKQVWRVSEDGEIRDTFQRLRYVFEMREQSFFDHYCKNQSNQRDEYLKQWTDQIDKLRNKIPQLPFSNIWIAKKIAHLLPEKSFVHFGILNSLSSWNFFDLPPSVSSNSNVGGFGIDGGLSSLLGASLFNKYKLYFGVIGDLAFFYDMNSIGNRHLGNNLRIIVINNGKGVEFKIKGNPAVQFGNETDEYIAAARHYGNKSSNLVRHYASDLGFEYFSASSKEEFLQVYENFIKQDNMNSSKLLEVFTNDFDEKMAHSLISQIESNMKSLTKNIAKKILSEKSIGTVKRIIRKN